VLVEWLRDGHPTNLGAASGIVAGLVAVTPAAGYVSGAAPIWIGLVAGVVCCYAVRLKSKFGYDDALDVVGVHFVGGLVGSLLIGFFANPAFFGLTDDGGVKFMEGIFYGGNLDLLLEQALANGAAIVWSFVITLAIMVVLKKTIGVRVSDEDEATGLDLALHSETAYHSGGLR
jgi:ammonium transporter, Amt family